MDLPHALRRVSVLVSDIVTDPENFDEIFDELEELSLQCGFTLSQLQVLVDTIVDPRSYFKTNQKTKLISILYCSELIDFETILKILCCFKVPTYYNTKSKIKFLHQTVQIKLSQFLVRNFANIQWEKRYLQILSTVFSTLHIGYLRYNMGLFLIFLLNISYELDPIYNKKFFFNYKKLSIVLEFYEFDPKTSLHLLLYFADHLNNTPKSDLFHMLYMKYSMILESVKIPSNLFGKLEISHLNTLISIRNGNISEDFRKNIQIFVSVVNNLNSTSISIQSISGRKRKFIEDVDILSNFRIYQIYSKENFRKNLYLLNQKRDDSFKSLLNLSNLNINDIHDQSISNRLLIDIEHTNLPLYYYLLENVLIVRRNITLLNRSIELILNTLETDTLTLTREMAWIFKGIGNYNCFNAENCYWGVLENIFCSKKLIEFKGSDEAKYSTLNMTQLIRFMKPDFDKYEDFLQEVIQYSINDNNKAMMHTLVNLANKWTVSPYDYNKLVQLIFKLFKAETCTIIDEILLLCSTIKRMSYESIEIETLILRVDIVMYAYFTQNMNIVNMLFDHILYCKKYFSEYGNRYLEDIKFRTFKNLHSSYIIDLCNVFWTEKPPASAQFALPPEFWSTIYETSKPFSILNNDLATEYLQNTDIQTDSEKKIQVLKRLREDSYTGIYDFLFSSVRSVQLAFRES